MRLRAAVVILMLLLAGCGRRGGESPGAGESVTSKYEPGQVWTYGHREGEEASRATICLVEPDGHGGVIVHLCVDGLSILNPQATSGVSETIGHLPFAEEAVDRSVREHVETRDVPDFRDGYDAWHAAMERQEAGVFTVTIGEAVDIVAQTISGG